MSFDWVVKRFFFFFLFLNDPDLYFHKLLEHLALESAYLKFHLFNKLNSNLSTKSPAWKCRLFILFTADLRCFIQNEDLCFKNKTHTPHF